MRIIDGTKSAAKSKAINRVHLANARDAGFVYHGGKLKLVAVIKRSSIENADWGQDPIKTWSTSEDKRRILVDMETGEVEFVSEQEYEWVAISTASIVV